MFPALELPIELIRGELERPADAEENDWRALWSNLVFSLVLFAFSLVLTARQRYDSMRK
jgi:hypothetical protein